MLNKLHSFRGKAALGGALVGLALLGFTASPSLAQTSPQSTMTHDQMHQMMDAMHGQGTSERMHQAMGADAERLMEQCVGMMNMMNGNMSGMMNGDMSGMMNGMMNGDMSGMMNGMMNGDMSGMMNGQNSESMQEMMRGMMGQ